MLLSPGSFCIIKGSEHRTGQESPLPEWWPTISDSGIPVKHADFIGNFCFCLGILLTELQKLHPHLLSRLPVLTVLACYHGETVNDQPVLGQICFCWFACSWHRRATLPIHIFCSLPGVSPKVADGVFCCGLSFGSVLIADSGLASAGWLLWAKLWVLGGFRPAQSVGLDCRWSHIC